MYLPGYAYAEGICPGAHLHYLNQQPMPFTDNSEIPVAQIIITAGPQLQHPSFSLQRVQTPRPDAIIILIRSFQCTICTAGDSNHEPPETSNHLPGTQVARQRDAVYRASPQCSLYSQPAAVRECGSDIDILWAFAKSNRSAGIRLGLLSSIASSCNVHWLHPVLRTRTFRTEKLHIISY